MLHGKIEVNDHVVGEWRAVRKSVDKRDFNDYGCFLTYTDLAGYRYEARWEIYGQSVQNGALGLAARVINEGLHKARRVFNE